MPAMMKKMMPTPWAEPVLPAPNQAMSTPASAGPTTREAENVALCSAIAFTTVSLGTISGTTAARAGIEKESTVPLKRPK